MSEKLRRGTVVHQGWNANLAGESVVSNPYPAGSDEFEWWFEGWDVAEQFKGDEDE